MKNVIFSIYVDIADDNLQNLSSYMGDDVPRSLRTKNKLAQYYQPLVDCKKQYADTCDADFVMFHADDQYTKFLQSMPNSIYEFDKINHYKHHLLELMSHEYDNVLYMDLDVVPVTQTSFFDAHDLSKFCIHCADASRSATWGMLNGAVARQLPCEEHGIPLTYEHAVEHHIDQYHWYMKKLCKDAMLLCEGLNDPNNLLANTAIMGGSASAIQAVKYFERLPDMLQVFDDVINECAMGDVITSKFFVNNEVFMSYIINKYQLPCTFLPSEWHYIQLPEYTNFVSKSEAHLWHIIDKRFEKIWKDHV